MGMAGARSAHLAILGPSIETTWVFLWKVDNFHNKVYDLYYSLSQKIQVSSVP